MATELTPLAPSPTIWQDYHAKRHARLAIIESQSGASRMADDFYS